MTSPEHLVASGAMLVSVGALPAVPELAAACLASPTCAAAYAAVETAGTVGDIATCAGGDLVSCGAVRGHSGFHDHDSRNGNLLMR